MRGGKIFSVQVRDPVMELVVKRRDKAAPLIFKGIVYSKGGISVVTEVREFWGI